jgi:hypothetical protein
MAATPSAQPRLWRRSHRPVATTARGSTVLTAERPSTAPHLGVTSGLWETPSNRRWRQMAAKPMDPLGQMEALEEVERMPHTAAAELAGIGRRGRWRFRIAREARGLGLESDRVRERVRGQLAGPGWSGQAHSG